MQFGFCKHYTKHLEGNRAAEVPVSSPQKLQACTYIGAGVPPDTLLCQQLCTFDHLEGQKQQNSAHFNQPNISSLHGCSTCISKVVGSCRVPGRPCHNGSGWLWCLPQWLWCNSFDTNPEPLLCWPLRCLYHVLFFYRSNCLHLPLQAV